MPNNARRTNEHRPAFLPVLRFTHGAGGSHHVEVPLREDQARTIHQTRRKAEEAEAGKLVQYSSSIP